MVPRWQRGGNTVATQRHRSKYAKVLNVSYSYESIEMAGYYDYVLGTIPAVMLTPVLTATLFGLSVPYAIIAGGAVAVPLVGHAMFVRAPVGNATPAETTTSADTPESVTETDTATPTARASTAADAPTAGGAGPSAAD